MTKYMNEVLASYYTSNTNLEAISLRYFNAYGYGENTKGFYSSVIDKFIHCILHNERPVIFGDGNQSRDLIYVMDIAKANVLAAKYGKPGETYNIGTGVTSTFNRIYEIVKEIFGTDLEPTYAPVPFKSYQYYTLADISKAKKELGFKPDFDLKSGIQEIAKLIEAHGQTQ